MKVKKEFQDNTNIKNKCDAFINTKKIDSKQ